LGACQLQIVSTQIVHVIIAKRKNDWALDRAAGPGQGGEEMPLGEVGEIFFKIC
jgi:hypothetical protein